CRACKSQKIECLWDSALDELFAVCQGKVTGVRLKNVKTGALSERPVNGLFVAIGHQPNTQLVRGQLELLPNEYIKVKPGTTQTSVPGVFAAGDVQDHTYRQAVAGGRNGCIGGAGGGGVLRAT